MHSSSAIRVALVVDGEQRGLRLELRVALTKWHQHGIALVCDAVCVVVPPAHDRRLTRSRLRLCTTVCASGWRLLSCGLLCAVCACGSGLDAHLALLSQNEVLVRVAQQLVVRFR